MQQYFKLYANCYPVKGAERSAVYNFKTRKIKFIPNSMYEVLVLLEQHPVDEVRQMFEAEDQSIFDEYMSFLKQEKLGFYTGEPEAFPALSMEWNAPEHISNAVVEFAGDHYRMDRVVDQLDALLCKHLELRIVRPPESRQDIERLLDQMKDKTFRSVFLFINYSSVLQEDFLRQLYEKYQKLHAVVIYNAPRSGKAGINGEKLYYINENIEQSHFEGVFPKDTYIISISYFTEALQYNPYYNRKVSIDRYGNIRNCLLHERSYGNVNSDSIREVVDTADFQDLWHACPDKIEGIRDAELRYCMLVTDDLEKVSEDHYRVRHKR